MKNKSLTNKLVIFTFFFTSGMWLSKIIQPIYFDDNGAINSFGFGYAVMAVTGGLAFFWGKISDSIGGLNTVLIGSILYAIGIAGRFYTSLTPVIFFSAISGIGASMVLVAIRPWIRSLADEDSIPMLVAAKNSSTQSGVLAGSILASIIVFLTVSIDINGPQLGIFLAPLFIVIGIIYIIPKRKREFKNKSTEYTESQDGNNYNKYTLLSLKLSILGIISGLYVSLITPYLPLIIRDLGLPNYGATLVVTAISISQIITTTCLSKIKKDINYKILFIITEFFTALISIICAIFINELVNFILIAFILRAVMSTLAATAEEVIQFAVIPASATGIIFGISQTAFLIGDALGGWSGAFLWSNFGASTMLLISGLLTLFNCILVPVFLRIQKNLNVL